MTSRYDNRNIGINETEQYKEVLDEKNLRLIRQYFTAEFKYPTIEEMSGLELISHTWKLGDKYYKLASKYYNDPKLWWIIAFFNKLPTEGHVKFGKIQLRHSLFIKLNID